MSAKPNVLIVSIDSLRPDYCSLYEDSETTTPFLEEFGKKSTVYEQAISPSVWTLQVHGSIFTGLYPIEHGVLDKGDALVDTETLAEILSEDGYQTESFGRNGWLESGEILRGFDHHRTPHSIHIRNEIRNGVDRLLEGDAIGAASGISGALIAVTEKLRRGIFRQHSIDEKTVSAVQQRIKSVEEPFCHFVHLNGVHYPFRPRAPYHRCYGDHSFYTRRRNVQLQRSIIDNRPRVYSGDMSIDADALAVIEDLYRGAIRHADDGLRELIKTLENNNQLSETIVIFFGDHGDHLGHNGHFGHQFSVDDRLLRVPLLVYDPTSTLQVGRSGDIVNLNDIFPTILTLTDQETPKTRSRDLTSERRDAAYTYYVAPDSVIERFASMERVSRSSLPPKRQYVVYESPENKTIWYPDEDRFEGPAMDSERLQMKLRTHFRGSISPETQCDSELSRDVEQNLREMGYL